MRAIGFSPSSFAFAADISTRADAPSFTPGALPAVTVPSFLNAGFSARSTSMRGVLARRFVHGEQLRRRALLLRRQLDRHDLVLEAALLDRSDRLAMRVDGVLVLLFARDAVLLGDVLAGVAHVVVVVDVPQAVVHHGVDDLAVAQAIALARLGSRYGALVMLSMPPATTISELPVWIACWPSATAFSPEPQTLLMVMAATADGQSAAERRLARRILSQVRR